LLWDELLQRYRLRRLSESRITDAPLYRIGLGATLGGRGSLKARTADHPSAVRQGYSGDDAALPVRGAQREYFADIPDIKVSREMLQLAEHIVDMKAARFAPSEFVDHYETAIVDLLKQKQSGKAIAKTPTKTPTRQEGNVIDLGCRLNQLAMWLAPGHVQISR
jgi:hypothetical protein